ncbi:hypothetical protein PISMIDRAFT_681448 [Pisolithus microcarpus 441]|uniref:Uncharacterized protein n=1 Tax=Pisolithus microcarpus 441 TaxID=765257 RepID=A0A0C9ZFI5_9AGAM|nr:hypothetical protein PISMIDRAFT_681448 [Pisolithus microcarpus 441]
MNYGIKESAEWRERASWPSDMNPFTPSPHTQQPPPRLSLVPVIHIVSQSSPSFNLSGRAARALLDP